MCARVLAVICEKGHKNVCRSVGWAIVPDGPPPIIREGLGATYNKCADNGATIFIALFYCRCPPRPPLLFVCGGFIRPMCKYSGLIGEGDRDNEARWLEIEGNLIVKQLLLANSEQKTRSMFGFTRTLHRPRIIHRKIQQI